MNSASLFDREIKHIHIIGIGGTAMGSFAGLLKSSGYKVTGSDEAIYSPMKEQLERWQISVNTPYSAENLRDNPDLVVVGNVIKATNVEALALQEKKLPFCSFPQALSELFLHKACNVVATGTHGKTTCSSLLAHTLDSAGFSPNFLIGGIPKNFGMSSRISPQASQYFVLEGDEYDTAFFDKRPKFLHYRPQHVLCTSIEFDHADIFKSVDDIRGWFTKLFELVPHNGCISVNAESPEACRAVKEAKIAGTVLWYNSTEAYHTLDAKEDASGISFTVAYQNQPLGSVRLQLSGKHSIDNALGSYVLLQQIGLSHEQIATGFKTFLGASRRMDIVGKENGVTVIDDFAHHPTALKSTLEGARQKYPDSKIWALFEPRSASSCRNIFQEQYAHSFGAADRVFIAPCGRNIEEGLSIQQLADDVAASGIAASAANSIEEIVKAVVKDADQGTVILCMSNGAFGGIHAKILQGLKTRS